MSACGCVQIDGEVSIKGDTSGVAELSYVVDEKTVVQFGHVIEATDRLAAAAGQSSVSFNPSAMRVFVNPEESSIRQYIGTLSPYGIALTDVRVRKGAGRRTVRVVLSFNDLRKAVTAPPLKDARLQFGKRPDGMWEFVREGAGGTNSVMTASSANAVTSAMGGFVARMRIKTPGVVVETTATRRSQKSVAWEFDFNREPNSVEQAFSSQLRVVYAP
jgi:hypothetical protein